MNHELGVSLRVEEAAKKAGLALLDESV